MLAPDRILTMARQLQAAVVTYYDQQLAIYELPSRHIITSSPQQEVLDCGQFVVSCEGTVGAVARPDVSDALAKLGDAAHAMRAATFTLTIARCGAEADETGLTDDDEEEEVAGEVWSDGVLMLNALVAAQRAGDLPSCGHIQFLDWRTTPQPSTIEWSTLRVAVGLLR